jgi:C-terminal processing protease CtpA/Prc
MFKLEPGESLGMKLAYQEFSTAHEKVIHVTEVMKGGPAEESGLTHFDYILGTKELLVNDLDDFE